MTPEVGYASNHDANLAEAQPGRVGPPRSVLSLCHPSSHHLGRKKSVLWRTSRRGFSFVFLGLGVYPKSWGRIFACVYPILLNSFFVSPLPQERHLVLPTSCQQFRSQDYQTNGFNIVLFTKFTSRVNEKGEIDKRLMPLYQLRPLELNLAPHILPIHPSID